MTSSGITAPAGYCDFAGRSTDHLARGCARGPILDLFHEFCGEHANALPSFLPTGICPPPVHLSAPGFGLGAPFIRSQRGVICQDFRASPHVTNSVNNVPMQSLYCIGGITWWVSHTQARVNHPRTAPEKR